MANKGKGAGDQKDTMDAASRYEAPGGGASKMREATDRLREWEEILKDMAQLGKRAEKTLKKPLGPYVSELGKEHDEVVKKATDRMKRAYVFGKD